MCLSLLIAVFSWLSVSAQDAVLAEPQKPQAAVNESYHSVKGKVMDAATKSGFAGIRISVIDTKITTMTSDDGLFELKVPFLNAALLLEAPGYCSQIVSLQGRSSLEIQMTEQTNAVGFYDEMTLSAKKANVVKRISNAITSIDEDFINRLNGEARAVSHSGTAGSGTALFIRGLNSLNMTAQPLYVVDGVIWQMQESHNSIHSGFFNNPLTLIDPNDVESITVLKDATAVYGSKGGNGVVLIKTKRSESMATEISASVTFGYRSPFETIPVMDGQAYRLYASDILSGMYSNSLMVENLKFLDDNPSSYYNANHNNTNWLNLINHSALTQNYGVDVKGGDAVALYSFSVGYNNSESNIENTGFNRLNVRFNSDINLTNKFKLQFDIAFAQTSSNVRNDGIDDATSPVYLSMIKSPLYSPYQYNRDGSLSNRLSALDELNVGNPLSLIQSGVGILQKYRFNTTVVPSYLFHEKFSLNLRFSYVWDKLNEELFRPSEGLAALPLLNQYGEIYAYSKNTVRNKMGRQNSIYADIYANWMPFKNNNIHDLNLYGGFRFYNDDYNSNYAEGHNTGSDRMNSLSNTVSSLRYSTGVSDIWRSMSWYLDTDYKYKNRFLLNASVAMDASSRFGKNAANSLKIGGVSWGVFPSVSAGWVVSSEEFMKNISFINFLKLDAAYSVSGNDDLPNYASQAYFISVPFAGNAYGIILDNLRNDELKWETSYRKKVGLDFSLLNNRLSVKTDFFDSKTKDLLTRKKLQEIAGVKQYWTNDGELQNKGFEIASNVRALNRRNLNLDVGFMLGHYKNKIISLADGFYITDFQGAQILTSEGHPAAVFYGYKTSGVFSTVQEAADAKLSIRSESGELIPFQAGDMHFVEGINDGVIDDKDRQIIGDPTPDFYGNFNFNLKYKNLTVETLFSYSYGNDAYNALRAALESGSNIHNQANSMQKRWVANGQKTDIPRAVYGDPMGNSRFSDRWIEDASFLKFKTLSISYKIPLNLSYLQAITVWAAANNLFTWTKYLGADPEFSYGNSVLYQGIDAGLIPSARSYYLGVKINL